MAAVSVIQNYVFDPIFGNMPTSPRFVL